MMSSMVKLPSSRLQTMIEKIVNHSKYQSSVKNVNGSYSRMMPSIEKLLSSPFGGGLARAPAKSRTSATGTMVEILEENNNSNYALSSSLQKDCCPTPKKPGV